MRFSVMAPEYAEYLLAAPIALHLQRAAPNVALRVQNLSVMSEVAATSNLVATLPERLALRLQEKYPLQVLPLPLTVPDVRMALYWHERTHKHAAHRWFRQALSDVAKAI